MMPITLSTNALCRPLPNVPPQAGIMCLLQVLAVDEEGETDYSSLS